MGFISALDVNIYTTRHIHYTYSIKMATVDKGDYTNKRQGTRQYYVQQQE